MGKPCLPTILTLLISSHTESGSFLCCCEFLQSPSWKLFFHICPLKTLSYTVYIIHRYISCSLKIIDEYTCHISSIQKMLIILCLIHMQLPCFIFFLLHFWEIFFTLGFLCHCSPVYQKDSSL